MFGVAGGVNQALDLFDTEQHGQALSPGPGPGQDAEPGLSPFEQLAVKTAQTGEDHIARVPGQTPLFDQVKQVGLDLVVIECVGSPAKIGGQPGQGIGVCLLGSG